MKIARLSLILLCAALLLCACAAPDTAPNPSPQVTQTPAAAQESVAPETTSLIDMAGRTVILPSNIERVFGTDPVATITLYTLVPDKLIGWNYAFNKQELQYIAAPYRDLPNYGMRDTLNAEAVIAANPQLIVQMGATDESAAQQADELQQKLGIPVVLLSGKMADIPHVYEMLGKLTGAEQVAQELSLYAQTALQRARDTQIAPDDVVTVYYGNGSLSLDTAPAGSDAAEVIELAGGKNVADIAFEKPSDRVTITPEQILQWNPDVMFVNGEPKDEISGASAAQSLLSDSNYASVRAVQSGQVYGIPKSPFSWLDRPKAANRILGLVWAGKTLYPAYYESVDISTEIQAFYELFYHVSLSKDDVQALLQS